VTDTPCARRGRRGEFIASDATTQNEARIRHLTSLATASRSEATCEDRDPSGSRASRHLYNSANGVVA
jgi:hypothetical protein